MTCDTFSFECALDQNRPAEARAALTVSDDGEHIVFNMSTHVGDGGREVYLSPDAAANLAHLVGSLVDDDMEPDDVPSAAKVLAGLVAVSMLVGLLSPLVIWAVLTFAS